MEFQLKDGMLLGAASAATQIEGGDDNSNWYDWYRRGYVKDDSDPSCAVDHYERWREDLELMKKKHRADEMRAIVEADMKYLKFMFDKLEKERQSNNNSISSYSSVSYDSNSSANDSVSLELGGVDIPVEAAPDAMTIVEGGAVDVEA